MYSVCKYNLNIVLIQCINSLFYKNSELKNNRIIIKIKQTIILIIIIIIPKINKDNKEIFFQI